MPDIPVAMLIPTSLISFIFGAVLLGSLVNSWWKKECVSRGHACFTRQDHIFRWKI